MPLSAAAPVAGRSLIHGEWSAPRTDFASTNPARLAEVVGSFPVSTNEEEAAQAVTAARAAYPAWRRSSRIARADCFERLARLIDRETDSLAHLMARECGKNIVECRAEVVEGLHMVQYVFGTGRMPYGEVIASEIPEKDAYVRRKPWGVVAVITPWNFPFAVPLWMLGPSLLEGNTAVFKPSEDTPAVGQRIVELFVEAGFPKGTINLVHGDGTVGEALVKNQNVNVVLFTGSYDVGRSIQRASAEFPDRIVAAEMGGKNALIVCEDARFDLAVKSGILSSLKTTGQRCVSASRILVHESLFGRYATAFVETAKRLKFGEPLDAANFAGPVIHEEHLKKVLAYNALAPGQENVDVLLDGHEIQPIAGSKGCFLSPFVYRCDWDPNRRVTKEEVFGPHVAIMPFKTDEEAVKIHNSVDYGLSMAVISESYRRIRYFRDECEYGMGYVNLPCIGAEVHLPFGGVKKSGNGHPSAAGLVSAVTHQTAFTVNHGTEIKMAQGLTADV